MKYKMTAACLLLLCTACASIEPQFRHYLLGDGAYAPPAPLQNAEAPNVALTQLAIAGFLDKSGIVYQVAPHEISIAARNLWAEPLPEQLSRVFYQALAGKAQQVSIYPDAQTAPVRSVRLAVTFTGFHGRYDGQALVAGVWSLADAQNQPLLRQPFQYEIALAGDGYDELVTALAQGLDAAAADIAASLDRFADARPEPSE